MATSTSKHIQNQDRRNGRITIATFRGKCRETCESQMGAFSYISTRMLKAYMRNILAVLQSNFSFDLVMASNCI